MSMDTKPTLRSGDSYRCGYCGYEGKCYGTPTSDKVGVSAPWCPRCGMNNRLIPINEQEETSKSLPRIDKATQTVYLTDGSWWTQAAIEMLPNEFVKACLCADWLKMREKA